VRRKWKGTEINLKLLSYKYILWFVIYVKNSKKDECVDALSVCNKFPLHYGNATSVRLFTHVLISLTLAYSLAPSYILTE